MCVCVSVRLLMCLVIAPSSEGSSGVVFQETGCLFVWVLVLSVNVSRSGLRGLCASLFDAACV